MPSQIFRSKKLLKMAKEVPYCFCCGKNNDGTIVAAHSNQLRDGKGTGIKAHDFRIAYICDKCHFEIDQGKKSKDEKKELWEDSHRNTIGWLFVTGRLEVINANKYE